MKFFSFVGKVFLILLETVLILCIALYGVMFILCKGPSSTARDLFVKSVKETSAIGFLANIYLNGNEITEIMNSKEATAVSEMDTSLVNIAQSSDENISSGQADAWGLVDDDGDGIVIEEVHGSTYSGYMMVVYDPSRVILGCNPGRFGSRGYTVEEMVERFGAVAGTNAGGFQDDAGMGDGSTPDTMVVFDYDSYYMGTRNSFVGIDGDGILHVDCQDSASIEKANIRWGCAYEQILVSNGKIVVDETKSSGLNPRTAIGQRSDGAILLLVIDGRHVVSLGATYYDEAEIMIKYGAVNAGNMDGGSSSLMYFNGEYVNNKAAVIGVRNIPTAWLVLPEGVDYSDLDLQ